MDIVLLIRNLWRLFTKAHLFILIKTNNKYSAKKITGKSFIRYFIKWLSTPKRIKDFFSIIFAITEIEEPCIIEDISLIN